MHAEFEDPLAKFQHPPAQRNLLDDFFSTLNDKEDYASHMKGENESGLHFRGPR